MLYKLEFHISPHQFQVSPDGTKVRMRKVKQISPRRSLLQVNRKWIKCCPGQEIASPKSVSSESSSTNMSFIEIISEEDEKKLLNQKISNLRAELAEMKNFLDIQTDANLKAQNALEEFYQLKMKCESFFPTIEKLCDEQKRLAIFIEEKKLENPKEKSNEKVNNQKVDEPATEDRQSLDSVSATSTLSPNSSSTSTCNKEFSHQDNCENENQSSEKSKKNVCFDFTNNHFPCEGFQVGDSEEIYVAGDHQNELKCCNNSSNNQNVNFWIQKLSHELSVKPDRCEFEMIKAQLFHLIRNVSKIKQIQLASSGAILPFMKITDRGVSRGTASQFNASKCGVPRLSKLTNGNQCIYEDNNHRRAVGGSHTRIYRANQVRNSKYARLVTPVKICSSLLVCRNRFR